MMEDSAHHFLDGRVPRNRFTYGALFSAASLSVIASALIIYTLASGTVRFFDYGEANLAEFLRGTNWLPNGRNPSFGIWPLLSGTALIAVGSLAISIPLGLQPPFTWENSRLLDQGGSSSPSLRYYLESPPLCTASSHCL